MRHQLETLNSLGTRVPEFSERLWHVLVDHATIAPTGEIAFTFKWESNSAE